MDRLIGELSDKLEESLHEVEQFKRVLTYEQLHNPNNFKLLSKYAPTILFSIWEGFFKDGIKYYFSFFNRTNEFEADYIMLTNIIEHHDVIDDYYVNFDAKKNLLKSIREVFDNPLFEEKRPEVKDVPGKFNKTNNFLKKIKLNPISSEFKSDYGSFAHFRNLGAHGGPAVNMSLEEITKFADLAISLMKNFEGNIISVCNNFVDD